MGTAADFFALPTPPDTPISAQEVSIPGRDSISDTPGSTRDSRNTYQE